MSWQIPTLIEADIKSGKAKYQTFETGNGGQSIMQVPPNSYVVIFGYDFSPAGGGIDCVGNALTNDGGFTALSVDRLRWFETQQISFYTGTDFYPFVHHVDRKTSGVAFDVGLTSYRTIESIDNNPIARQIYITSTNDVTITHGLILNATPATTGAIPVTSRTPGFLTYGGAPQAIQAQTNYGPGATPQQFIQPSTKDFQDFALGLLPNNATDQAFATPDVTNGLKEANVHLLSLGADYPRAAATNYYLCLHYAIYPQAVPEQRG